MGPFPAIGWEVTALCAQRGGGRLLVKLLLVKFSLPSARPDCMPPVSTTVTYPLQSEMSQEAELSKQVMTTFFSSDTHTSTHSYTYTHTHTHTASG